MGILQLSVASMCLNLTLLEEKIYTLAEEKKGILQFYRKERILHSRRKEKISRFYKRREHKKSDLTLLRKKEKNERS